MSVNKYEKGNYFFFYLPFSIIPNIENSFISLALKTLRCKYFLRSLQFELYLL